jgi:hypothetical protein
MVLDVISPREDSKGNTRWVRVGVGFPNGNGTRVLLDAYPVPNEKGECVLLIRERKDNNVSKKNES